MKEEISGGSYIRLKEAPTKIYKVTSVNERAKLVDATQQNGKRIPLELSDVELATDDDMLKYEDKSIQIDY